MSRVIRSAMLQMRVSPEIKLASEHVLRRIGLNLTEATELFMRRMIIDQRIPFEVIAVDNATYAQLVSSLGGRDAHDGDQAPERLAEVSGESAGWIEAGVKEK